MAELQFTEDQQAQIASLLSAVDQDEVQRERFRADPRAVFGDYGLAYLIPDGVQLEVEMQDPQTGVQPGDHQSELASHFDSAHYDSHIKPGDSPLPPSHLDFPHIDAPMLEGGAASIKVTPVLRVSIVPTSPAVSPDDGIKAPPPAGEKL
ncbi:MAG: hypothetical protein ACJ74U_04605 [Jatrophihabitantaceae bacterium]